MRAASGWTRCCPSCYDEGHAPDAPHAANYPPGRLTRAGFTGPESVLDGLRLVEADLRAVGRITGEVPWAASSEPLAVAVELAAAE